MDLEEVVRVEVEQKGAEDVLVRNPILQKRVVVRVRAPSLVLSLLRRSLFLLLGKLRFLSRLRLVLYHNLNS